MYDLYNVTFIAHTREQDTVVYTLLKVAISLRLTRPICYLIRLVGLIYISSVHYFNKT